MSVAGTRQLTVATPLGEQRVVLELTETDGKVTGTAKSGAETVPLLDPALDGDRRTWRQSIIRPLRLHLQFDVTVEGDTLTGTAKAGLLTAAPVTGTRVG